MSYLVFARKYRPLTFSEVEGQEQVTRTLANAIRREKVAHAYLFAGPRGVGKTSIARIFSKALNCEQGPTPEPCLKCSNCTEIATGSNLAVREIDGASHNSVDNVRELIESFRSLPPPGSRYKIYIIDEVHMLSTSAFNALLKSLEEPPPNTVFILATTEAHKIPDTVISRCQRHEFRALSYDAIEKRLREIVRQEKASIDDESLRMIARLSDGSMRDAQSLLDRVISFADGTVTAEETSAVLGVVSKRVLLELSHAVFQHDTDRIFEVIDETFATGIDPVIFLKEFVGHWREILLGALGGEKALARIGVGSDRVTDILRQVEGVGSQDIQDLCQLAREGADNSLRSSYPKYAIESLLVRMATRPSVKDIGELVGGIKTLVESGTVTRRSSGAGSRSAGTAAGGELVSARPVRSAGTSIRKSSTSRASKSPIKMQRESIVAEEAVGTTLQMPAARSSQHLENTAKVIQVSEPVELNWPDFVNAVLQHSSRMIGEHLKRLHIEAFVDGSLIARGPDFTISYLEKKENKQKLLVELRAFGTAVDWTLDLKKGNGSSEPESILGKEEKAREQTVMKKKNSIKNHPTVKSLKEYFPGSTISGIDEE